MLMLNTGGHVAVFSHVSLRESWSLFLLGWCDGSVGLLVGELILPSHDGTLSVVVHLGCIAVSIPTILIGRVGRSKIFFQPTQQGFWFFFVEEILGCSLGKCFLVDSLSALVNRAGTVNLAPVTIVSPTFVPNWPGGARLLFLVGCDLGWLLVGFPSFLLLAYFVCPGFGVFCNAGVAVAYRSSLCVASDSSMPLFVIGLIFCIVVQLFHGSAGCWVLLDQLFFAEVESIFWLRGSSYWDMFVCSRD